MNQYKALRLIALRDVLMEPPDYHVRFIHRWYSRTFHVPLLEVENLSPDHVLQAFYESKYEEMSEEEREEERQLLLENEDERRARLLEDEREQFAATEFERQAEEIAMRQDAEAAKIAAKPLAPKPVAPPPMVMPNLEISGPATPAPPNIKVSFISDAEFRRRLEGDGLEGPDDPRDGNLPLKPPPYTK